MPLLPLNPISNGRMRETPPMSFVFLLSLICFMVLPHALHSQAIITTVAGSGRALPASEIPATDISFGTLSGLAVDPAGNVFISDQAAHVVYKVTPDGKASIFAGTGMRGFSGDGGPAIMAALDMPRRLATGLDGSVYIADGNNQRIRKVDSSGGITSVAGGGDGLTPWTLYEGAPAANIAFDEYEAPVVRANGDLYFTGAINLWKVNSKGLTSRIAGNRFLEYSGDGGPALNASFRLPIGLAFDGSGNLFVSDSGNFRIRKIGLDGIVTTVAGNGESGYDGDGGPAISAQLGSPSGIAVDSKGNLYIGEYYAGRVRMVDPNGIITTIAGNWSNPGNYGDGGPAAQAEMGSIISIALDQFGNLYLADDKSARVRKVDMHGIITTFAGNGRSNFSGDGGPATLAKLDSPTDVAIDKTGNLFVADYGNQRIRKITTDGTITTIAGNGTRGTSGVGGPATEANLDGPIGIALDDNGGIYISETSRRILKVDPSGHLSIVEQISGKEGGQIAVDKNANVYIASHYRIDKLSPSGVVTTIAGIDEPGYSGDGGPATQAKIWGPSAPAFDSLGNLLFADAQNNRVRQIGLDGTITTVAGNGAMGGSLSQEGNDAISMGFETPAAVGIDDAGNLFFESSSIFRVNPGGHVTYLNYENTGPVLKSGFAGDGGPARAALVGFGTLIGTGRFALDLKGNLYMADTGNDRIRKIAGIDSPQVLRVSDHFLDFAADSGGRSKTVEVTNLGTGTLSWRASVSTNLGGNWLSVSPASGTAPSIATISADPSSMPPGVYSGKVSFLSDGSSSSPWTVMVTLKVQGSFPHVVVGGGYTTTLSIHNPGTAYADGTLTFVDQGGNPMQVTLTDLGNEQESVPGSSHPGAVGSSFPVGIHSGAAKILSISAPSETDEAKAGWVKTSYANPTGTASVPNGTAIYNLKDGEVLRTFVGVMAAQLSKVATIPIDNSLTEERYTAFAVANPSANPIWIRLITVNESGTVLDDIQPPQLNPLGPGKQVAIYLHDLLPSRATFRGSFILVSDSDPGFIATALIQDRGKLTSIPVIPAASAAILNTASSSNSGPNTAVFPQIAIGGGWTTGVVLVNTGNTTVNANLVLSGSDGSPFNAVLTTSTIDIFGARTIVSTFASSVPISLPPGGTSFISATPANAEDPAQGGWARVESPNGGLFGVATFQYAPGSSLQTIAGVLSTDALTSATLPINDDNEKGRWTGYAVANPGNSPIKIKVLAVRIDGTIAARLTPILLDPGNRASAFFNGDPALETNFRGSIVLAGEEGATFSAIAVLQDQGEDGPLYTSVPVIRGKALGIE
jgi:sugar lactone lactonase YvrE